MSEPHEHMRRDADTLIALGLFLVPLGTLVIIGAYFIEHKASYFPFFIDILAGLIVGGIGVGFIIRGLSGRKKSQ